MSGKQTPAADGAAKQRKVRAKRIRREARERTAKKRKGAADVVEPDQIDEYDEAAIKAMVARTPEVRFRHASYFTDDEDRIIAASLKGRVQLYKVAASLKCSYPTLKKHIENTPVLAEIAKEAREIECGEVREAIDDLIKMRHPQVVMWRAKQLMPQEFGDAMEAEEDDTRIVIGAIPDELIAEADRTLALAAEKPPETGLTAMLDTRAQGAQPVAHSDRQSRPVAAKAPAAAGEPPVEAAESSPTETADPEEASDEEDAYPEEAADELLADGGIDFSGDDLGF